MGSVRDLVVEFCWGLFETWLWSFVSDLLTFAIFVRNSCYLRNWCYFWIYPGLLFLIVCIGTFVFIRDFHLLFGDRICYAR